MKDLNCGAYKEDFVSGVLECWSIDLKLWERLSSRDRSGGGVDRNEKSLPPYERFC